MALLGFEKEGEGFRFRHSTKANQGIEQAKRIETASIVVATDESGDFQSIQEAINSLDDKGGYIQIKEGDFRTTDKILIPSNVTIEGVGYNTRIIRTTDGHIFENEDTSGGNSNINIKNIRFRGTNLGLNAAIHMQEATDCQISGIMTEQLYYSSFIEDSIRVSIDKCISLDSNLGYGVGLDGVYDCIITNNNLYGENVSLNLINCENCVIIGNICNDAGDIGISLDSNSTKNTITGNMAADCATGIFCFGEYNIISSNCAENGGIFLSTSSNNNIVTSNLGDVTDNGSSNTKDNNINV